MPHSYAHIGEELKHRRLERGETLSAISKRLRISVTYLNAIEVLDADSFPALSYGIGYARSYANVLGMPADAVVERFKADMSIRQIETYQGPKQRVKRRRFMLPKGIISGAAVTILAASLVGWFGVHAEDQIKLSSTLTAVADIDVRAEAPLPSDMYRLTAVGPSWVEIRLPENNVLVRRILIPGERWEGAVQSGLTITARDGHALHLQRGNHNYGSLTNKSERLDATPFDVLEALLSAKTVSR